MAVGDRVSGLLRREAVAAQMLTDPQAPLAPFYTPEVRYWGARIRDWAATYGLNPNVIAILIQVESCGSPEVISWAGAVGLMQVMPYHFDDGENMLDPETNMRHAMRIFTECLTVFANWDIGVAAACYNGGASVTQTSYQSWPQETRHYYDWVTGLWADVVRGAKSSPALATWLAAGGTRLCAIAAAHQRAPAIQAPGTFPSP